METHAACEATHEHTGDIYAGFGPWAGHSGWARAFLLIVAALAAAVCLAQAPAPARAILLDGAGPWRDANWALGVTEFSSLLADAGYQVSTVSPVDLPTVALTPDMLLAVPSLQSL